MRFIDAHDFPVGLVLRVLDIASSTYYDWRARATLPARRQREDAELLSLIDEIRASHEFAGTYGSPRVWLELRRRGVRVGRKRVERIMRENDRRGAYLRKGWKGGSTKQNPRHIAAPDLLDRDFTATAPNRKWVADLTRIPTREGVLWLASVRDAFSNKVVGWRTGPRADTDLVLSALDYALFSRDVRGGELIFHSDKGCQYTALRFTQRLIDAGIAPSTGSVGDSFDNALAENLWSTLKIELIYWPATIFATRTEAESALFRYIDTWYNPRRIQAGLAGLSPDEYEFAHLARPELQEADIIQAELTGAR
ncbi:IS3 family transposase [Rhodococcus wratislaviensis]|uniref:IS3 family transposase n=1 Tax=Rhodococcus wratislaviensis TaxID=44752 RepID=UPI003651CDD6